MLTVSIIIPCYNVQDYIVECVQSTVDQLYNNIEIICIDNNSTDKTWDILNELKRKYSKLIIEKEFKAGANAARNKGLTLAKGKWIQFLDADDLIEPNKISHQISLVEKQKTDVAFIAAACKRRAVSGHETTDFTIEPNHFIAAFTNQAGNTCANLWNYDTLKKINGWNEDIKSSQEADLMLRIVLDGGNFIIDKEPLTIIRSRENGQISQNNPIQNWKRYIDVRVTFLKKLKEIDPVSYQINKSVYQDSLLISILILAKYDRKEANDYYTRFIRNDWHSTYRFGLSRSKVAFIKVFGLNFYISLMSVQKSFGK